MVDVSPKTPTLRWARASGQVVMRAETLRLILDRGMAKGDVLEVARLAGIMGAKRTSDLIPLCHPLPIEAIEVSFAPAGVATLRNEARVQTTGRTGVEMEALTAVSVAALTIYDMCKAIDRAMVIGPIQLEEKAGGKSGPFRRESGATPESVADPACPAGQRQDS
jgi:cyclic pyranopterin phosphate synthase